MSNDTDQVSEQAQSQGNNQNPPGTEKPDTNNQGNDLFSEFIGEGKKYSSVEKAVKSIPYKDDHIEKLEKENAEMREAINQQKGIQDLLDELKSLKQTQPEPSSSQGFDPNSINELVKTQLLAHQQATIEEDNFNQAYQRLTERYGEKTQEVLTQKASELDMAPKELAQLARTKPKAFSAVLGLNVAPQSKNPTKETSSVNTFSLEANNNQAPPKTVMGGSTTNDMIAAWNASGERVNQRYKT